MERRGLMGKYKSISYTLDKINNIELVSRKVSVTFLHYHIRYIIIFQLILLV